MLGFFYLLVIFVGLPFFIFLFLYATILQNKKNNFENRCGETGPFVHGRALGTGMDASNGQREGP